MTIAGTEVVTKIVFYYFHERLWALVLWGHGRNEALPETLTAPAAQL